MKFDYRLAVFLRVCARLELMTYRAVDTAVDILINNAGLRDT
jgi:hypothetical protein